MSVEVLSTSTPVVTLAEAKAYCRIDGNDDDSVLVGLIAAATDWVAEETGTTVLPSTLRLTLDSFPTERELKLPCPPLRDVNVIRYTDDQGTSHTLSSSAYSTNTAARPGRITLNPGQQWPATSGRAASVTVEYDAGPSDDRPLSPSLKQAILFTVAHWFEHREAATDRRIDEVPLTVQAVLSKHRFIEVV